MNHLAMIFMLAMIISCSETAKKESVVNIKSDTDDYKIMSLDKLPQRGDLLHDSIRLTSKNQMQLVSSSVISQSTTIYFNGYRFEIAWTNDGKVNYIATYDKNFMTPENIKVSTTLKEIKEIQNIEIGTMPGWGYFVNLESGWNVAFCVDKTCTGRKIVDSDSVKWIYK